MSRETADEALDALHAAAERIALLEAEVRSSYYAGFKAGRAETKASYDQWEQDREAEQERPLDVDLVTALLGELAESPLPGARYAYDVVKRRLAKPLIHDEPVE